MNKSPINIPPFQFIIRYCPKCGRKMTKVGIIDFKLNSDGSWSDYHVCDKCKAYLVVPTKRENLTNWIEKINKYEMFNDPIE